MIPRDDARGRVQVSRPGVVAQPGPRRDNVIDVGIRQIHEAWKDGDELRVSKAYNPGAGLLQHRLGDPDTVRVLLTPPGKIPAGGSVPSQQAAPEDIRVGSSYPIRPIRGTPWKPVFPQPEM